MKNNVWLMMIFRDFRWWCKPRLVTGVNKVRWLTIILSYKTVTSGKQYFLIPSELMGEQSFRENKVVLIVKS